jgi:hypothetical protein
MDQVNTIKIIMRNFVWRGMEKYIEDFVHIGESWHSSKVPSHVHYSLLSAQELPIYHGKVSL